MTTHPTSSAWRRAGFLPRPHHILTRIFWPSCYVCLLTLHSFLSLLTFFFLLMFEHSRRVIAHRCPPLSLPSCRALLDHCLPRCHPPRPPTTLPSCIIVLPHCHPSTSLLRCCPPTPLPRCLPSQAPPALLPSHAPPVLSLLVPPPRPCVPMPSPSHVPPRHCPAALSSSGLVSVSV